MHRSVSIALFVVLASAYAGGQQANPPQPQPQAAPPPEPVKVYAPHSGVKAPRLLPLDPSPAWTKKCEYEWDGEVVFALLVDTEGRPRNIMFQRPSGSFVDRVALQIAVMDRFEPGTLGGKPVVVAESLKIRLETCIVKSKDAAGKVTAERFFRSLPHQKLEKPKNPPQEAVLAPLETPRSEIIRKVTRPDYFGGGVSAPVLIYSVDARYTPSQRDAKIKGVCKIALVVDAHGLPQDVHVLKSLDPGLDRSAIAAVNMYRFFPAIEDEQPVPAAVVVDVNFEPPEPVVNVPDLE